MLEFGKYLIEMTSENPDRPDGYYKEGKYSDKIKIKVYENLDSLATGSPTKHIRVLGNFEIKIKRLEAKKFLEQIREGIEKIVSKSK